MGAKRGAILVAASQLIDASQNTSTINLIPRDSIFSVRSKKLHDCSKSSLVGEPDLMLPEPKEPVLIKPFFLMIEGLARH